MDNLRYKLIFDLVKKTKELNLLKVVKFQNLFEKCCNVCPHVIKINRKFLTTYSY